MIQELDLQKLIRDKAIWADLSAENTDVSSRLDDELIGPLLKEHFDELNDLWVMCRVADEKYIGLLNLFFNIIKLVFIHRLWLIISVFIILPPIFTEYIIRLVCQIRSK